MKNIQVIDRAENCIFPIYQVTDKEFSVLFPGDRQDIEYAEDFAARVGHHAAGKILQKIWERPIRKQDIVGLHGTLFYEYEDRRTHFPVSQRECDFSHSVLNEAQRKMHSEAKV